jgi:phosphoglucomutase
LQDARMIKTIVTTELGRAVADSYSVPTLETLTGFKFIAEKIGQFEETGEKFIFGFEESYGYLIESFARDKDAVQAAVMAAEMAYYYKQQGKTLLDALEDLFEKHGYYLEGMTSLTLKGKEGSEKIQRIMKEIRQSPFEEIAGINVQVQEDYLTAERRILTDGTTETIELPKENVLKFILEGNAWVCLRPSGTEPKIKCYYGVCGESQQESDEKLQKLKETMEARIDQIIA